MSDTCQATVARAGLSPRTSNQGTLQFLACDAHPCTVAIIAVNVGLRELGRAVDRKDDEA